MERKPKIDLKELANKAGKATVDAAQSVGKTAVSVAGITKDLTEKSQQAILGSIDQNGNGEVDIEDVIIMGLKIPGIRSHPPLSCPCPSLWRANHGRRLR